MKKTISTILLLSLALAVSSCGANPDENTTASGMNMGHSMTISNEKDFLMMMIPHHEEAIKTSEYMLTRNPSADLKSFLNGVVGTQTREVKTMTGWLKGWYGVTNLAEDMYSPMMPRLDNLSDQEAAMAYVDGMIAHHQGAVEMAKTVISMAEHNQLRSFAQHIVEVQSDEIRMLNTMKGRLSSTGTTMRNR